MLRKICSGAMYERILFTHHALNEKSFDTPIEDLDAFKKMLAFYTFDGKVHAEPMLSLKAFFEHRKKTLRNHFKN